LAVAQTAAPKPPACAHCGLAVPKALVRDDQERQFCCSGCEQVFTLLSESGLGGYYRLLDRQAGRGVPARVTGRGFAELDDPAILAERTKAGPRGLRRMPLFLEGVHCAACVWLVETLPQTVPGLQRVGLNLASGVAEIEFDPALVPLSRVARAFDSIGYTPHLCERSELAAARKREDRNLLVKAGVALACSMNIMDISMALYAGGASDMSALYETYFRWVALAISLPVVLFSAKPFFVGAWSGLVRRVPHIDLPLALAILGAWTYSVVSVVRGHGPVYFDSIAGLVSLLLGARWAQMRAQRVAIERTEGLRSVAFAEYARRLGPDGSATEVPVSALAVGDRVEVRSGDLVPVDGTVLLGRSGVDQAVLTGETDPLEVAPGDWVYAGGTNAGARLVVEARAVGNATRVGALLKLVDEAMSKRPRLVELTDRLSRHFVVGVLAGSVLLFAATALFTSGGVAEGLARVVALLVVTCPCALALATPVTAALSLSRAARAGIFIKNPEALERSQKLGVLVLDKTGTLTEGVIRVVDARGHDEALALAVALEAESSHPIARALRRDLQGPARLVRTITDVKETAGRGISGRVDGKAVAVGNEAHVRDAGCVLSDEWSAWAQARAGLGLTPVLVGVDGEVRAVIALGDPLRDDARPTLAALVGDGLTPYIFSGDHPEVVAHVARALGVPPERARGGLTPEEKRTLVGELTAKRRGVMMVGDGVNDAAALAAADVGVVVHGGSGAAVVAADVVLTREGLRPVEDLLLGSRRMGCVVRRNLTFSILYNLAGGGLAALGLVGPLAAAVLMPISSITVILSSIFGETFAARSSGRRRC
jgi:Cu2+-exporting ATPase